MTRINWVELGESVRTFLAQRAEARHDQGHEPIDPPRMLDHSEAPAGEKGHPLSESSDSRERVERA